MCPLASLGVPASSVSLLPLFICFNSCRASTDTRPVPVRDCSRATPTRFWTAHKEETDKEITQKGRTCVSYTGLPSLDSTFRIKSASASPLPLCVQPLYVHDTPCFGLSVVLHSVVSISSSVLCSDASSRSVQAHLELGLPACPSLYISAIAC